MEEKRDQKPRDLIDRISVLTRRLADQNQLLKKIRRDRRFTAAILHTVREPILVLNSDKRVVFANQAFYRFFQVTPEETHQRQLKELGRGQLDIDVLMKTIDRVFTTGQGFEDYPVRIHLPRVGWKELLLNGRKISSGGVAGELLLLAVEDVTERREAERALQRSRAQYVRLIENNADGILVLDRRGQIRFANRAAETIFGRARNAIVGEPFTFPLVVDETTEIEIPRGNDPPHTYEMRIVDTEWQGEKAYLALLHDITERKIAEQVVRESEVKFRTFFENTHEVIFMSDENDHIYEINRAGLLLLKYTRKQISRLHFGDLFVNPAELESVKKRIARRGFVKDLAVMLRTRKGEKLNCLLTAAQRIDTEGKARGIQGIIRDVTAQVRLEQELRTALEEARKANEVKSLFLANMSHEIRTPLHGILGFIELIEESLGKYAGEKEKMFFEYIRNSGERLMRTVHEILDISQIEAGTYEMNVVTLDLVQLVEEVLRDFQLRVKEKDLHLTFSSDYSAFPVKADQYSLFQAVSHLVDNAIKFTDEGKVEIRLFRDDDGHARLQIADTGVGISREYQEHLYDIFSQESTGYTKKFQGIGLGLALVKRYLDLNGIPIECDSVKGKGTTFTLTFTPAESSDQWAGKTAERVVARKGDGWEDGRVE
jgi:PAS domain S-box-containing protein